MIGRRALVVTALLALAGCGWRSGAANEGFDTIHVADLVAMRNAADPPPVVLDADAKDFRAREGIIPGATLLSSYKAYDVATELPADKGTHLVFYCANSH